MSFSFALLPFAPTFAAHSEEIRKPRSPDHAARDPGNARSFIAASGLRFTQSGLRSLRLLNGVSCSHRNAGQRLAEMENGWPRDLVIAVAGALIGSVLLYLFSVGFRWSANARKKTREQRERDLADWNSGDSAKQQKVFNAYLFSVLKLFIIGNILIGVAAVISYVEPNVFGLHPLDFIAAAVNALGVIFFIATLAEIFQFTKLVRPKS